MSGLRSALILLAVLGAIGSPPGRAFAQAGGEVTGRVLDPDGRAVAGCEVSLGEQVTATDESGRFRLRPLAAEHNAVLRLEAPGFALRQQALSDAAIARAIDLGEFRLSRGVRVTGSVTAPDGAAVGGAHVFFTTPYGHLETTAARSGRFEFARVDPGRYDLLIEARGHPPSGWPGIVVTTGGGPLELGGLEVDPGIEVTGSLEDSAGRPVRGTTVEITYDTTDPAFAGRLIHERVKRRAVTDASGAFRILGARAGGSISLRLDSDSHLFHTQLELADAEATVDLGTVRANELATFVGRVSTPSGEPVPNATIHARTRGGLRSYSGRMVHTTDADGRFVATRETGEYLLAIEALGFERLDDFAVRFESGPRSEVQIPLTPVRSGSLEIRVEPPSGAALPQGLEVVLEGLSGPAEYVSETLPLDPISEVAWPRLPVGRYEVSVRNSVGSRRLRKETLDLGEGPNRRIVTLPPPETSAIAGRLLDGAGQPVRLASLRFSRSEPSWFSAAAVSDGDGRFVADLAPGRYSVDVDHPEMADLQLLDVEIEGGATELGAWRLDRGSSVTGRIHGLTRRELARTRIAANSESGGLGGWLDSTGRFRVDHLTPGSWTVVAEISNSGRRESAAVEIDPEADPPELALTFGAESELAGRVTDGGAPLAGARVLVNPLDHGHGSRGSAISDSNGSFSLRGLSPGLYYLNVSVPGVGRIHQRGLELPVAEPLEIALWTGRAGGRVIRADDGLPLTSTFVRFVPVEMDIPNAHEVTMVTSHERFMGVETDADGRFEAGPLEEGKWRVEVQADGFVPGSAEFTIDDGNSIDDLELSVVATPGLHFSVETELGPIPYAVHCKLRDADGDNVAERVFGPEQAERIHWKDAPPGKWRLLVTSQVMGAHTELPVSVPGPPVRVVLPAVGKLHVLVRPLLEDAVAARIRLVDAEGNAVPARGRDGSADGGWPISENRRFYLWSVEPGFHRVEIEAEDGRSWSRWAAVDADRVTDVVFE